MVMNRLVTSLIIFFVFSPVAQMQAKAGETRPLFTFAFPHLAPNKFAYQNCQKVIQNIQGYRVNFSGFATSRAPIDNALAQMILSRDIMTDGMSERNQTTDATYTLQLGKHKGFYANTRMQVFCLFSKQ